MSGFSPFQDYSAIQVRPAAILTGSYVEGTVIGSNSAPGTEKNYEKNRLVLLVDFTIGSLTSASIKVEFSHDGVDFFQETFESVAAGTATGTLGVHTIAATGKYRLPPIEMKDRFVKVSAIGTGTATGSSMSILAVVGVA